MSKMAPVKVGRLGGFTEEDPTSFGAFLTAHFYNGMPEWVEDRTFLVVGLHNMKITAAFYVKEEAARYIGLNTNMFGLVERGRA